MEVGWRTESMSSPAFNNALRGLQPRRQAIGSRLLPAAWHWREPPFLVLALEAEPALAVFACDGHTSAKWSPSPVRRIPALHTAREALAARRGGPPVSLSSLRCGGRHQPHLPPLAGRVEKRPIAHAQVLRRCLRAKVCARVFCVAGRVPQRANSATVFFFLAAGNVRCLRFLLGDAVSAYRASSPNRGGRS